MNAYTTLPPAGAAIVHQPHRLIALSRMLDAIRDEELERTIEMLIAVRDARDADPDLEPNGDEADSTGAEDELPPRDFYNAGPGCAISDPDFTVDEMVESAAGLGDRSYVEWHTLPAAARRAGRIEGAAIDGNPGIHEDMEDDDVDTSVEDHPLGFDPETDMGAEDSGEGGTWPETGEGNQPDMMLGGLAIMEDDFERDCESLRRERRDRIHRTRCQPVYRGRYHVGYRLPSKPAEWVRA